MEAPGFEEASLIVQGNCAMCHAAAPSWPGLYWAPKGLLLETPAQIALHAPDILMQAGLSHAMPPPGSGFMMDDESRQAIVDWVRGAE
jgi:uncharacterized membrane protein